MNLIVDIDKKEYEKIFNKYAEKLDIKPKMVGFIREKDGTYRIFERCS